MAIFSDNDLKIIEDNLELPPRELIKFLEGEYTSVQITKCKWYIRNRDKELKRMEEYREDNKDKIKDIQKRWRDKNSSYEKQRHKQWREENHVYDLQRRRDYRAKLKKKYNIPDKYGGKGQALVRGYAEEVLGDTALEEFKFDWLRTEQGYLMPVDIYFPKYGLIIEYNGQQHYFPVDFGSGTKEAHEKYKRQCVRDQLKYKLIKEQGIELLVIPYNMGKTEIIKLLEAVKKGDDINGQTESESYFERDRSKCWKVRRVQRLKR